MEDSKKNPFSIMQFIEDNPSATMAGFGALKGLLDQPRANAQAQAEIAKTQWSPWLGGGPGNPMAVKQPDALGNAVSGAMAGHIQKKNDEFNKAVADALKPSPYKKPEEVATPRDSVSLEDAKAHENPYHPVMIERPNENQQVDLGANMFMESPYHPSIKKPQQSPVLPYRR